MRREWFLRLLGAAPAAPLLPEPKRRCRKHHRGRRSEYEVGLVPHKRIDALKQVPMPLDEVKAILKDVGAIS